MRTIQCTNPNCNAQIPVPDGAMQVICPECSTWHFPDPGDFQASQQDTPQQYGQEPPGYDQQSPGYGQQSGDQDLGIPPYISYESQPDEEMNKTADVQADEVTSARDTPGYLVSSEGTRYALKLGKNTIGRRDTDLVLGDKTVSRRHCVVEVTPDPDEGEWSYVLYDIGQIEGKGSTNGVFITGRSLRLQNHERIQIYNGTTIQVGKVTLTLQFE